jgi:hypothetical protein
MLSLFCYFKRVDSLEFHNFTYRDDRDEKGASLLSAGAITRRLFKGYHHTLDLFRNY